MSMSNKELFKEIQNYVTVNGISGLKDLKGSKFKHYKDFTKKLRPLGYQLSFSKSFVDSQEEMKLIRLLVKYGITNIKTGITFPDFIKNTRPYRFDIFLPDFNTFIEVNGKQHFDPNISKEYWTNWRSNVKEDDIKKKNYVESKGYNIIYYTTYKNFYETYGYFTVVYTNIRDVISYLGLDFKENPNYEEDIKTLNIVWTKEKSREDIKNIIQSYIDNHKISSPTELKKRKSVYSNYLYEYNLRKEINFINTKPYDPAKINSVEDINNIIINNKIIHQKELVKSKFSGLYEMAKYKKWVKQLKYYSESLNEENTSTNP